MTTTKHSTARFKISPGASKVTANAKNLRHLNFALAFSYFQMLLTSIQFAHDFEDNGGVRRMREKECKDADSLSFDQCDGGCESNMVGLHWLKEEQKSQEQTKVRGWGRPEE